MKSYEELQKSWSVLFSELAVDTQKKLNTLFTTDDEIQIQANIELLLALDDCALCYVLKQKGDQLELTNGLSQEILLKKLIVAHVTSTESDWFGLYQQGFFAQMSLVLFASVSYTSLSEEQQKQLFEESLKQVLVPSGGFIMGALEQDYAAYYYEKPQHKVVLTKSMSVCIYTVTQALYEAVMGTNPSRIIGAIQPVVNVSWHDCLLFCNTLSEREGFEPVYFIPAHARNDWEYETWSKEVRWNKEANGYRLPTEAEWEYSARARAYTLYAGSNHMDDIGWYCSNTQSAQPVGQKSPNAFGLYDMSGNIWEWCWDTALFNNRRNFTGASLYTPQDQIDPIMDLCIPRRIGRGGSYSYEEKFARVSYRNGFTISYRNNTVGFRILRTVSEG